MSGDRKRRSWSQCCGSGSGIRIRNPMPFWPLDSGSGIRDGRGIRIWDEQPGSYFLDLTNHILSKNTSILLCGSGMEKVRIRDKKIRIREKHPGSANTAWSQIRRKQKCVGLYSIFSFAQQSIYGIYLELLLYLDLWLGHAEGVGEFCALRPRQVLGLLKRLLQGEDLLTGERGPEQKRDIETCI